MGQDAKGGRFHYYVCGTLLKKGSGSCRAQYIRSQKLEQAVIDQIKEKILTYDNLKELVCLVNEEIDNAAAEYRRRLSSIDIELKNVNSRLERLYDSLETGLMQVADLAPRIQHLRQRQEQLEVTRWELEAALSDRKVELADMETVSNYVADLRNLLNESSLVERKSFIRSFVKEVRVRGVEVLLNYTIPLSVKGVTEDTVAVPPIVHYGGAGVSIGRTFSTTFALVY